MTPCDALACHNVAHHYVTLATRVVPLCDHHNYDLLTGHPVDTPRGQVRL